MSIERVEDRDEAIRHYRELRKSVNQHLSGALRFVKKNAMMDAARSLGITSDHKTIASSFDEMQLACDVAVFGRKPDERLRAIDRYSRQTTSPDGSMDAATLASLLSDQFCIIEVIEPHKVAGLVVEDINRKSEMWLMDEGFEATASPGLMLAARMIQPTTFFMTAGGAIPINQDVVADALSRRGIWMKNSPTTTLADPRFPAALYAAAIKNKVMEKFQFKDV
jgi:hypothetical protein